MNVGRMGLFCGATTQVLVGVSGVHLCRRRRWLVLPQLLPCHTPPTSSDSGNILDQRSFPVARKPFVSRPGTLSVSCMLTPREGSQELKQQQNQQLSTIAADLSTSRSPSPAGVVEHVVFFKVKDDPKAEELFEELRALKSLDVVDDLSASKVLHILGANYTHALHSRHANKVALDAYAVHPSHQAIVKKLAPFVEDRLAVDWEAIPVGITTKGGHGAARIALIKLMNGVTAEDISQIFGLLSGLRDKFPFIRQTSVGSNISPERAKGFNLGFLATFDNVKELKQLDGNSELHRELRQGRVSASLQSFVIVDIDSKHK